MKKKIIFEMKKAAALFTAAALLIPITAKPLTASAEETNNITVDTKKTDRIHTGTSADAVVKVSYGDFEYTVLDDGTAEITYYYGYDEEVTVPDTINGLAVTSIGDAAFALRDFITSITIGNNVTNIGMAAFAYCTSLTSITIPNSVTSIDDCAFWDCEALESLTIPDSVTYIGCDLFYACYYLANINVDEKNEYYSSIDGVLFNKDQTELLAYPEGKTDDEYTIPDSVTAIEESAFECCNLESVIIGNNVESICDYAFYECASLESITIPYGVTSIGCEAFGLCFYMTNINVDEKNEYYSSIDGVLFNKEQTKLLAYPAGKTDAEYAIPDSVTAIEDFAFEFCNLESVIIGNNVESMGMGAFEYCDSLTDITIPDSVTRIEEDTFLFCESLTCISIGNSVADIGSCAFLGCISLTAVTIPESVMNIGEEVFYGCTALADIVILDGVTSIGLGAFAYCTSLTSITIPNSVTSIDDYAFWYCESLESLTIPYSVTNIGYEMFYACFYLTSINVDEKNEYYSSIDGVLFNKDQTELLAYPEGKTGDAYTIPSSVTAIGDCAFELCNLKRITVGDNVESIGDYAFSESHLMTVIIISDSVTYIGDYAFDYCELLTAYSSAGSYAEKYAKQNNIPFVAITDFDRLIGDINYDGAITVSDALSACRISVGLDSCDDELFIYADVNNDDYVTIYDCLDIARYSVGFATSSNVGRTII